MNANAGAETLVRIADALESAMSCSREVIDLVVTTFAAGGHLLLDDRMPMDVTIAAVVLLVCSLAFIIAQWHGLIALGTLLSPVISNNVIRMAIRLRDSWVRFPNSAASM